MEEISKLEQAVDKLMKEKSTYRIKGILSDWADEIISEFETTPELIDAVLDLKKTAAGFIAVTAEYGFAHKTVVDKRIVDPLLTEGEIYEIDYSRWIPVSERLPEEKINPITEDFYEYQCTYHSYGIYDVRSYKFGDGHWWHGPSIMDDSVIAWRPLPEPYQPKGAEE